MIKTIICILKNNNDQKYEKSYYRYFIFLSCFVFPNSLSTPPGLSFKEDLCTMNFNTFFILLCKVIFNTCILICVVFFFILSDFCFLILILFNFLTLKIYLYTYLKIKQYLYLLLLLLFKVR